MRFCWQAGGGRAQPCDFVLARYGRLVVAETVNGSTLPTASAFEAYDPIGRVQPVAQILCSSNSAALHLINIHFLLIHGVGLDARIQEEPQSLKGKDSPLLSS